MRWIWIDTFIEFESARRAVAVKNVTFAEDHVHDQFEGYAVFPATLMIEGMAQTAGILVGELRGFAQNVILAKIRRAEFEDYAVPGDRLTYEAEIESITDAAAGTVGKVLKNGQRIGEVDLLFSYMDEQSAPPGVPRRNFVFTEQFMGLLNAYQIKGRSDDAA